MTLLTTEIHNHREPARALIIYAADRRLSLNSGAPAAERVKIMRISGLNGGIGYFGLAEIPGATPRKFMDDWLSDFMATQAWTSLRQFSLALADALNAAIPLVHRKSLASGFHVSGFDTRGQIEFWYVRNIDDWGRVTLGRYEAREDFQSRDASQVRPGGFWIYRNGDIRAHVVAWSEIDNSLGVLLGTPTFRRLTSAPDYVDWVRFKMETIAAFYETFATRSIIGRPIDAFAITMP